MSNLNIVLLQQLKTKGHFSFLGNDGYTVNAHDLDGIYSLEVYDQHGTITYEGYTDLPRILHHVKAHGGHLYH